MANILSVKHLSCFGKSGRKDGEFQLPCGITMDASKNVYIADAGNNRIQELDPQGKFLMKFGIGKGGWWRKEGKLSHPTGTTIDKN